MEGGKGYLSFGKVMRELTCTKFLKITSCDIKYAHAPRVSAFFFDVAARSNEKRDVVLPSTTTYLSLLA